MLVRLSKNAHVLQYGPFSYVLERIANCDEIYRDAEVFLRWITREPADAEWIVKRISQNCIGTSYEEVFADFKVFLSRLEALGVVVCGESKSELDSKDRTFSWHCSKVSGNEVLI